MFSLPAAKERVCHLKSLSTREILLTFSCEHFCSEDGAIAPFAASETSLLFTHQILSHQSHFRPSAEFGHLYIYIKLLGMTKTTHAQDFIRPGRFQMISASLMILLDNFTVIIFQILTEVFMSLLQKLKQPAATVLMILKFIYWQTKVYTHSRQTEFKHCLYVIEDWS